MKNECKQRRKGRREGACLLVVALPLGGPLSSQGKREKKWPSRISFAKEFLILHRISDLEGPSK